MPSRPQRSAPSGFGSLRLRKRCRLLPILAKPTSRRTSSRKHNGGDRHRRLARAGVARRRAGAAGFAGGIAVVVIADGDGARNDARTPRNPPAAALSRRLCKRHPREGGNRAQHESMGPCGRAGGACRCGDLLRSVGMESDPANGALRQHHLGSGRNPDVGVRLRLDRAQRLRERVKGASKSTNRLTLPVEETV
jgi:hypothetical protein